jgi:hypothetical protein
MILLRWWYVVVRELDKRLLWPACRDFAEDIEQARGAFAIHAFQEPAWLVLGPAEVVRRIEALD